MLGINIIVGYGLSNEAFHDITFHKIQLPIVWRSSWKPNIIMSLILRDQIS